MAYLKEPGIDVFPGDIINSHGVSCMVHEIRKCSADCSPSLCINRVVAKVSRVGNASVKKWMCLFRSCLVSPKIRINKIGEV